MYLLSWNADTQTVFAGLGGVVTTGESVVFGEELNDLLGMIGEEGTTVEVNMTKVQRFGEGALEEVEKLMFVCSQKGARMNLISQESVEELMSPNVRAILEGTEHTFVPIQVAA